MDFLSNLQPEVIIQGGLTLTVLGLIWFLRYLANVIEGSNKRFFNHTNDVIIKNTEVITQQAVSNEKLSNSLDNLVDYLKKKK